MMSCGAAAVSITQKKKLYQEENWSLPVRVVQQIMQDETSMVLPPLDAADEPASTAYWIAIADMDTQQEYIHPEPLKSLANYQIYFLNSCDLMKNIDFANEMGGELFPPLKPPGKNGMGPVTMELIRLPSCGKLFKVTVVAAPKNGNLTLYVKSPPLPTTYPDYTALCTTSMQRRACLRHYAMLGLARGSQMHIHHTQQEEPAQDKKEMSKMIQDAILRHGDAAVQNKGMHCDIISGVCTMHELERTAASVSLPLVLKYLCFLQFNLEEDAPFSYHIMAPNKCSYMVHIPNVGGWEVYYQVNMNASLEALEFAFAESQSPGTDRLQLSQKNEKSEAFVSRLFQNLSLQPYEKSVLLSKNIFAKIMNQKNQIEQKYAADVVHADPSVWDANTFYDMMQLKGMDFLQQDILSRGQVYDTYSSVQKAKPLLRYLSAFFQGNVKKEDHISMPRETILHIALDAFMGAVGDTWDNIKAKKTKTESFLQLLANDKKDAYLSVDTAYLPFMIKACLDCPSVVWWQRLVQHVQANNNNDPASGDGGTRPSTLLCTTFLFHSSKFSSFFPRALLTTEGNWEQAIDQACMANEELNNAKNAYITLCNADKKGGRYKNQLLTPEENDERKRFDYCSAIAYLMLLGNAEDKLKAMKAL